MFEGYSTRTVEDSSQGDKIGDRTLSTRTFAEDLVFVFDEDVRLQRAILKLNNIRNKIYNTQISRGMAFHESILKGKR
jgi:hypothetical protein